LVHAPSGVLCTFPPRHWSAIRHQGVLSLRGWPPHIQSAVRGCGPTEDRHREAGRFRLRDDCPLWCAVPRASTTDRLGNSRRDSHIPGRRPTTPRTQRVAAYTYKVWAIPLSLATTRGVSVDFLSPGY